MHKNSKIYIAGHRGMVGGAIKRQLLDMGYNNIIVRTSSELDLTNQSEVVDFFNSERPEYVFLAAAKVGGILANNTYRANFLYENLMIQSNVIHSSFNTGVKKLLFLASSCIYPKLAEQPIKESALLSGPLEPTNEPYAIAKIAGVKLCENYRRQYGCDFISIMPTNLFGPGDNYDAATSHVVPALIKKVHEAKLQNQSSIEIWGTGSALREFMYVDDLAFAAHFLMEKYSDEICINVGTGEEYSILELARQIMQIVGFQGKITHDLSKPDGTPRKLMDSSKIRRLGFQHQYSLKEGLKLAYADFLKSHNK